MTVALYIVPLILFMIWGWLIYTDIKKMKEVNKIDGLQNCKNLYDVKRIAKQNTESQLFEVYIMLKKYRRKKIGLWFLSLFFSVIILIVTGVLSALLPLLD